MSDTTPIISITGEKVALGPIHRGIIPLAQRWMNDFPTTRFIRMGVYSWENEEDWYADMASGVNRHHFVIYEYPAMRAIGGVDLHEIDMANRKAMLGIMIGEADARGKGYGTEAVRLICDYGFQVLGLHSISLLTSGWNIAGQKAYEKAGFRLSGRQREARWFAGKYWDDLWYDILASEFESPVLKDVLTEGLDID